MGKPNTGRWVMRVRLVILVLAFGLFVFSRPACQKRDFCLDERPEISADPIVGEYVGKHGRRVLLRADGTFCRHSGSHSHAESGEWSKGRSTTNPMPRLYRPPHHLLSTHIKFHVLGACGESSRRTWGPITRYSADLDRDGGHSHRGLDIWWGSGPATHLRRNE